MCPVFLGLGLEAEDGVEVWQSIGQFTSITCLLMAYLLVVACWGCERKCSPVLCLGSGRSDGVCRLIGLSVP